MTSNRFSHLCLHKPPLKSIGHRHSPAFLSSPNLLLPTALTTPGVLPFDAGFTREPSWHNYLEPCSADNAIICQQMSRAVPAWGCLDHTWQNQVVTFMPSNQIQTIELSRTKNGSSSPQLSWLHIEIQIEATKVAENYLKTKCLCPISWAKKELNMFSPSLLETNYNIPCTSFHWGVCSWQVCLLDSQNVIIVSNQWVGQRLS